MSRTERYQQIRALLLSKRQITFDALLKHFEVSKATMRRDLSFLRDRLGIPVEYDRDQGTYCIDQNHKAHELPGIWLTEQEIYALLSMQQLLDGIDSSRFLHAQLKPIREKLVALLGHGPNESHEIRRRIHIVGVTSRPFDSHFFQLIAQATICRNQVSLTYHARSTGEQTTRTVSPQRLTHYRDNWYLDAWCHTRRALRRFALDEVTQASTLNLLALDIDDETLEKEFASGFGVFSGENVQWARLRFSALRARWVSRERWHPKQQGHFLDDGRYELGLPYNKDTELVMDILKHGPDCEVLAPPSLRDHIKALLKQSISGYGVSFGETPAE